MKKIATFMTLCLLALFIIQPDRYVQSFLSALDIWALNILPVTLPFLVATALLDRLNNAKNTSSSTKQHIAQAFIMSVLCGYPIGAKQLSQLYLKGKINQRQAISLVPLLSHPSLLFVLITVGVSFLNNIVMGVIITISCILSSTITAIVVYKMQFFRNKEVFCHLQSSSEATLSTQRKPLSNEIRQNSIWQSTQTILFIGANVAIFAVLCEIITCVSESLQFDLNKLYYLFGILEMTNGCLATANLPPIWRAATCCCIVTFGGLCVASQSIPYYKICKIKPLTAICTKLLQAAFSLIIFFALYSVYNIFR